MILTLDIYIDFYFLGQSKALGPYQYCLSTSIGGAYANDQSSTVIPQHQPGNN